jgi:hypothetical protein
VRPERAPVARSKSKATIGRGRPSTELFDEITSLSPALLAAKMFQPVVHRGTEVGTRTGAPIPSMVTGNTKTTPSPDTRSQ